ncbi:hypothetical protein WICPIJ_002343 [Wickerhamomyces pijperi]|uniref:Zn(2)-C6 fungal-type domain-containing protein n=1 Tax=Wickerhamomyces pijperi TaxID=599730 RepID=A0A9P8QC18_WICPI|nr:hypothetical protein WICPIJ_002343 [Wickerhamomyces pijperi]
MTVSKNKNNNSNNKKKQRSTSRTKNSPTKQKEDGAPGKPHRKTRIATQSRSRSGCLTCRARHIKCDERLPDCRNCEKSQRVCEHGIRLNFLKTITVDPWKPQISKKRGRKYKDPEVRKHQLQEHERLQYLLSRVNVPKTYHSPITFLDQSLTVHNAHQPNDYHDYSRWLANGHTLEELAKSDEDYLQGIADHIVSSDDLSEPMTASSSNSGTTTTVLPVTAETQYYRDVDYSLLFGEISSDCTSSSVTSSPGTVCSSGSFSGYVVNPNNTYNSHIINNNITGTSSATGSDFSLHSHQLNYPTASHLNTHSMEYTSYIANDNIYSSDQEFTFKDFIVRFFHITHQNQNMSSLFGQNHRLSIQIQLDSLQISLDDAILNTEHCDLSSLDFNGYIDFLDALVLLRTTYPSSRLIQTHFYILLNVCNLCVKSGDYTLFMTDSVVSMKFRSLIQRLINEPMFQTYENLLNFFELLALHLNYSMIHQDLSSVSTSPSASVSPTPPLVFNYDEFDFEFLVDKLLHMSLCNDMNFFLVKILAILLKLNWEVLKTANGTHTGPEIDFELRIAIERLKKIHMNRILVHYLPHYDELTGVLLFQNLKVKRIAMLYNFTIYYLTTVCRFTDISSEMKLQQRDAGQGTADLVSFWDNYDSDPRRRMQRLVRDYSSQDEDNILTFFSAYVFA